MDNDLTYVTEGLVLEFTEQVIGIMAERGLSRRKLSKLLECHESTLFQILKGRSITFKTLARFAKALDMEVHVVLTPKASGFQENQNSMISTT